MKIIFKKTEAKDRLSKSLPISNPTQEVNNFISTISYLKNAGDAHVNQKNYSRAIDLYTNALTYMDKLTKDYINEIRLKSN